jgi:trk system potassium uptake protein TrkA
MNFRNIQKKINTREFAVIGLGRFGASLAMALAESHCTVVGIDRDPVLVQRFADRLTQTIALDATDEDALKEAGIHLFDTVVVAIGTDFESNLISAVALKALGVHRVVCKAVTNRQKSILLQVGVDKVVLPEIDAGHHLALDLTHPTLLSQLRLDDEVGLVELHVPPDLYGLTLRQTDLRKRFGVTIVAIIRSKERYFSPDADFQLLAGDVIMVIGSNADIERFSEAA